MTERLSGRFHRRTRCRGNPRRVDCLWDSSGAWPRVVVCGHVRRMGVSGVGSGCGCLVFPSLPRCAERSVIAVPAMWSTVARAT